MCDWAHHGSVCGFLVFLLLIATKPCALFQYRTCDYMCFIVFVKHLYPTSLSIPTCFSTGRSQTVLLRLCVGGFKYDVCFVIVCSSSLLRFVPREVVLCDCGISWLSSHSFERESRQANTYKLTWAPSYADMLGWRAQTR